MHLYPTPITIGEMNVKQVSEINAGLIPLGYRLAVTKSISKSIESTTERCRNRSDHEINKPEAVTLIAVPAVWPWPCEEHDLGIAPRPMPAATMEQLDTRKSILAVLAVHGMGLMSAQEEARSQQEIVVLFDQQIREPLEII